MDCTCHYESPLGGITLASDGQNLVGLWFDGSKHFASSLCTTGTMSDVQPVFAVTARWLDVYFSGEEPDFTPPILLRGTDFQKSVWEILLTIPYGETVTYGDIANEIAKQRVVAKMSAQAVGGAVGRNPIGIIVPCHRVIGSDGSLTGYAAGLDKKIKLLELEGAQRGR